MKTRDRQSPLPTIIAALVVLAALYFAVKSGLVDKLSASLTGSGPRGYAERMAGLLLDTPDCAKYRAAILAYRGQSTSSQAVAGSIARAYEDGLAAGCRRSDVSE